MSDKWKSAVCSCAGLLIAGGYAVGDFLILAKSLKPLAQISERPFTLHVRWNIVAPPLQPAWRTQQHDGYLDAGQRFQFNLTPANVAKALPRLTGRRTSADCLRGLLTPPSHCGGPDSHIKQKIR